MDIKVDLHLHTYYSDGEYSPEELIEKVHQKNISIISVVDHDSIEAIPEACKIADKYGIEIIPGVELSASLDDKEIHILGYFVDITDNEFNNYLNFFKSERIHRAKRIVQKLNNLGLKIKLDDIIDKNLHLNIGRPHIASAMVKLKLVSNYYEAFNKYLKNDGPAYEKKVHLSPKNAIKIINDAGGLAFLAHPGDIEEKLLMQLIDCGLDGIEVIHPSHSKSKRKYYSKITDQFMLLKSGGSDFHGGEKFDEKNLGNYLVPVDFVEVMKKHLFKFTA